MADVVSKEKRSQMMAGIRSKNTKPEKIIRSGLHRQGLRFRLHRNDLPGTPDLVFPRFKAVLFVHGCFFHGHGCHMFKWPQGETAEFWRKKITRNQEVDQRAVGELLPAGWRVGVVWECVLKGKRKLPLYDVIDSCRNWILSEEKFFEISSII